MSSFLKLVLCHRMYNSRAETYQSTVQAQIMQPHNRVLWNMIYATLTMNVIGNSIDTMVEQSFGAWVLILRLPHFHVNSGFRVTYTIQLTHRTMVRAHNSKQINTFNSHFVHFVPGRATVSHLDSMHGIVRSSWSRFPDITHWIYDSYALSHRYILIDIHVFTLFLRY